MSTTEPIDDPDAGLPSPKPAGSPPSQFRQQLLYVALAAVAVALAVVWAVYLLHEPGHGPAQPNGTAPQNAPLTAPPPQS